MRHICGFTGSFQILGIMSVERPHSARGCAGAGGVYAVRFVRNNDALISHAQCLPYYEIVFAP